MFNQLSHYCSSVPYFVTSGRAGKINYALGFFTRALPCFTELHSLFYVNKVKVIPEDLYNILTPVALAHVLMGDGVAKDSGLIICTDSFTIPDIVRLINVLIVKYRLDCRLRYHTPTQPRIYITGRSMPLLREIVKPYFPPSMLFKLKL